MLRVGGLSEDEAEQQADAQIGYLMENRFYKHLREAGYVEAHVVKLQGRYIGQSSSSDEMV